MDVPVNKRLIIENGPLQDHGLSADPSSAGHVVVAKSSGVARPHPSSTERCNFASTVEGGGVISVQSRNGVNVKMLQLCIFVAYFSERKHEKQNGVSSKYVKCH